MFIAVLILQILSVIELYSILIDFTVILFYISGVQEGHQTTQFYDGLTSPIINASVLYHRLNVSIRNDHLLNLSK